MSRHLDHCHHHPHVSRGIDPRRRRRTLTEGHEARTGWTLWWAECACGWLQSRHSWRSALIEALRHAELPL